MPILDPPLMLALIENEDIQEENKNNRFLLYFLKVASDNIYRNRSTIEASIQFEIDIINGISFFNKQLGCDLDLPDKIRNNCTDNIYQIFYDNINPTRSNDNTDFDSVSGSYYLYDSQLRFYHSYTPFKTYSWYFTSTSVAILRISYLEYDKSEDLLNILKYMSIEADLIKASGYTIAVCIHMKKIFSEEFNRSLLEFVRSHFLTEIHLLLDIEDDTNLNDFLLLFQENIDLLNSYFYVYTQFFKDLSSTASDALKKLRQNPFFQLFSFSKKVQFAISRNYKLSDISRFVFCRTGFTSDQIFVRLVNVPLYDGEDEDEFMEPSQITDFITAFVDPSDFMQCSTNQRVKIMIYDDDDVHDLVDKYIDADDLQSIKIELYIKETLFLTKTAEKTLKSIDEILNKIMKKCQKNGKFKKESVFSLFKDKKILKILTYVSYAYTKCFQRKNSEFFMHKNQIFTALEACKVFLNNNLEDVKNDNSGVIYQVQTGEGKSCIICIIAALLAMMKKTVHITSSNITLANRDYHESYEFFKSIGLKSAILLHFNELPVDLSKKQTKTSSSEFTYNPDFFPKQFFDESLFNNSSNMNFSVCGITNDNEISKNKANIVFSTLINFESLYLKMMEMCPGYIDNFFKECCLVIDEADSILIDELTNGTILSHSMKTNGNEVLKFVYQSYMEKKSENEVFNQVKEKFPKCKDLQIEDIRDMFSQIEVVQQEEFQDGRKYSIEIKEKVEKLTLESIVNNSKKALIKSLKNIGKNKDSKKKKHRDNQIEEFEQNYVNEEEEDDKNGLTIDESKNDIFEADELEEKEDKKKKDKKSRKYSKIDKDKKRRKESKDDILEVEDTTEFEERDEKTKKDKKSRKDSKTEKEKERRKESKDGILEVEDTTEFEERDEKTKKDKKSRKDSKTEKERERKKESKSDILESNEIIEEKDGNMKKDKKRRKDEVENKNGKGTHSIFKKEKITYKEIVPFDYDHKGVLEPNKEFSGFIQQFIAIKEIFNSKENSNMRIKDVSMNYLYVSHPIFVNMYSGVCGLTGTIGSNHDKNIFKEQYKLSTMAIPSNKPKLRIELPTILCENINERNNKIASEVIDFNQKGNPVLVIFQDFNEISAVFKILSLKGLKNINIFDGKDEKIKPDVIAGVKGAISLGTNVCGRGTDIKNPAKPLHVIITYFTSNLRTMQQMYGRTARQGNEGSVRIICMYDQYISPIEILNKNEMKSILDDFQYKNCLQRSFINKYKKNRKWIFSGGMTSQKFTDDEITKLREARINVNRITACDYEYQICMSISSFLMVQAQKIYSLFNCPNCKYTWMLFQKYIREMILESWSIFIDKAEKKYYGQKFQTNFKDFLEEEAQQLYKELAIYLPENLKNPYEYEIVPTFMNIFNVVRKTFENKIIDTFPSELTKLMKKSERHQFCSFMIGFKPYSLLDKSGSRINSIDGDEQKQTFIQDPELKYMRQQPHHKFSLLSITERIDGVFNMICQKINEVIGTYIGLKFFLRRTLGGCEFGICYDFDIEAIDPSILNDPNCLVDRDPLLLFTISVKSMVPILAGILIIGLVYIASVSNSIFQWISSFSLKGLIDIGVKTVKKVVSHVLESQIDKFCSAICDFLQKKLSQQLNKMKSYRSEMSKLFTLLLKLISHKDFSKSGEMVGKLFEGKVKINMDFFEQLIDGVPVHHFLKIGFLILLCFASFMLNFHFHNMAIKYNSAKVAAEYDKKPDETEEVFEKNKDLIESEKISELKVKFKND